MAKKPLKDALQDGTVSVEYCLQRKSKQDRIYMAKHGLYIDELIALNDPRLIIELIRYGHAQEHYDSWKTHKDGEVRQALAKAGYFPHHFIQDKNKGVREAVLTKHTEYCGVLLKRSNEGHWKYIAQTIDENWTLDDIKTFLDTPIPNDTYNPRFIPIRTYYQARATVPTLIEKTMTPLQLCKADNLLWTLPYSGNQVALTNNILRDPLNNLTAEFIFSALDYGVQNSSELVSYTIYHQKN